MNFPYENDGDVDRDDIDEDDGGWWWMMVDEDDGGSVNFNDDAFVHCWDNCRPTVWIQRLLPRTTQRLLTKKMLLAKGKILGPVKVSSQKNVACKRKNRDQF